MRRVLLAQRPRREQGFTYFGLLVAVAVMGAALAATGHVWRTVALQDQEEELLFAGDQFRAAIAAYFAAAPAGQLRYPRNLEDLLADRRVPYQRRYLRRLYTDPITGGAQWGIVPAPGGGIAGVYSLSEARPLKQANFPPAYGKFENAAHYSDWRFVHVPRDSAR